MYYSIYPKLRAIFTYLPTEEDYRDLSKTRSLNEFKNRFEQLDLLKRFPIEDKSVAEYLKKGSFQLEEQVQQRLEGKKQNFFTEFMRIYELKDIRNGISNQKGVFYLFQSEKQSLEEIGSVLESTIWKEAWDYGYDRYKDKGNKFEIEVALERQYYINLIEAAQELSWNDRSTVVNLLKEWINSLNKNWKYRLHNKYQEEDYEIKQYLIPKTYTYNNIEKVDSLTGEEFERKTQAKFYHIFKNEMFTLAALISFFMIFRSKMARLNSIYTSKKFNIEFDKLAQVIGV